MTPPVEAKAQWKTRKKGEIGVWCKFVEDNIPKFCVGRGDIDSSSRPFYMILIHIYDCTSPLAFESSDSTKKQMLASCFDDS